MPGGRTSVIAKLQGFEAGVSLHTEVVGLSVDSIHAQAFTEDLWTQGLDRRACRGLRVNVYKRPAAKRRVCHRGGAYPEPREEAGAFG